MLEELSEAVEAYHNKYHPDQPNLTPKSAEHDLVQFRYDIFREESLEANEEFMLLLDAFELGYSEDHKVEIVSALVHELGDTIFAAMGGMQRLGVDPGVVLKFIIEANMSKVRNYEPHGKAIKPEGFVPAQVKILEYVRSLDD